MPLSPPSRAMEQQVRDRGAADSGRPLRRSLIRALLAVAGFAIPGGLAFAWWYAHHGQPRYVTASVTRGDVQRSVSMTGALNPVVTVQVGSYVSGIIKSLGCDYNTEVTVGKVCAKIDPLPYRVVVDQDQAQVGTAEAQLHKDEAALAYAKTSYERDLQLLPQGIASQDTIDADKSSVDQAKAQVALDVATIAERKAVLEAAQVNLAYTDIVSPVDGTVITRNIDVGQTVVSSLQSATLFLIGKDLSKMQVDTNVSEADVSAVRLGQRAFFTVQAYPAKTFWGTVSQIRQGPITVQNVVTYDVVVAVDNPDHELLTGMTADTHIVTDEHDDVLRVPLPAVRFSPEGIAHPRHGGETAGDTHGDSHHPHDGSGHPRHFGEGEGQRRSRIWLLRDGELRPVPVSTGLDDGTLVEVSGEGIEAGQEVVVNQARPASAGGGQSDDHRGSPLGQPRQIPRNGRGF